MIEITVYRQGSMTPLDDEDAAKIIGVAFESGFTEKMGHQHYRYSNLPGVFDIYFGEVDR